MIAINSIDAQVKGAAAEQVSLWVEQMQASFHLQDQAELPGLFFAPQNETLLQAVVMMAHQNQ